MRHVFLFLFMASLLQAGCETTFEPFDESDRYYSIYGYLDPDADTQFVRVIPLRDTILAGSGRIDATVMLTDAASGQAYAWQDSVFRFLTFRDATGNVFWSTVKPVSGRTYRFSVQRADGAASRVTVTVPRPPPVPTVEETSEFSASVRRRVRWPEAFNAAAVEMVYHVRDTVTGERQTVVVPYTDAFQKLDGVSEVVIDLTQDYAEVYQVFDFPPGTTAGRIALRGLEVRVVKASDDWSFVSSDIDVETLALPTAFSNVEHGFGFLGAVVRASYPWKLSPPDAVKDAGYTDEQGP